MSNSGWLVLLFIVFAIVVVFVIVKEYTIYRAVHNQESLFSLKNGQEPLVATQSLASIIQNVMQKIDQRIQNLSVVRMKQINQELGFTGPDEQIGEFRQFLINNKSYKEVSKEIEDGWKYAGNFNDKDPGDRLHRGARAFPNKTWGKVSSVQECQQRADVRGHRVIGLQYEGECWTGTDLNQAKQHGVYGGWQKHPFGTEWNNQVYHRVTAEVQNLEETSYKSLIQELKKIGINNYESLKLAVALQPIEPMTTNADPEAENDAAMMDINDTLGFTVEDGKFAEFKQYIISKGYIKGIETTDNGWKYKGYYYDRRDSPAIQNLNSPPAGEEQGYYIFDLEECQKIADAQGHTVIGIQSAGSMCFSGNEMGKAIKYGEVQDEPSTLYKLGSELKNQVYYKDISSQNLFSEESYSTFIQQLMSIGIDSYGKMLEWMKANPGKPLVPNEAPKNITEMISYLKTYGSDFARKAGFFITTGDVKKEGAKPRYPPPRPQQPYRPHQQYNLPPYRPQQQYQQKVNRVVQSNQPAPNTQSTPVNVPTNQNTQNAPVTNGRTRTSTNPPPYHPQPTPQERMDQQNLTMYFNEIKPYLQTNTGSTQCNMPQCMDYSREFIQKIANKNINSPDKIVSIRSILSQIGVNSNMDILSPLNKLNEFGVDTDQIRKPEFLEPYLKFGFNPQTDLPKTIDTLRGMNLSGNPKVPDGMVGFKEFVKMSPFGININNMAKFNKYLKDINYSIEPTKLKFFVETVLTFDKTYPGNTMETLQNFRDILVNLKMKIQDFWVFQSDLYFISTQTDKDKNTIMTKTPKYTMTCDLSQFMDAFTVHYNAYVSSRTKNNPIIPNTIQFNDAWANFNTMLKSRKFNTTADGDTCDICLFVSGLRVPYFEVPGTDIQPHNCFHYTGDTKEGFVGTYIREGAQTKGRDVHVRRIGISKWIDKMGVDPHKFSIDGKNVITFSAFQSLLKTQLGIRTPDQEQKFLTFVNSVNVPIDKVKYFIKLLNSFGASYTNGTFEQFKQNCDNVGINDYSIIANFVSTLTRFGVNVHTMTNFIYKCSEFGVNFKVYPNGFFKMVELFELYEISYARNDYDSNSTYFETFVNNMIREDINNDCIDTIVSPLLKTLNNGRVPEQPPSSSVSGITKTRRNLRDVLVPRKDLFQNERALSNTRYFRSLDKNGNEANMFVGYKIPDNVRTTDGNRINAQIIDSRLFYRYIVCGKTINSPPPVYLNYPFICSVLTHNEFSYMACGTANKVLDSHSVMGRLLKIVMLKLESHKNAAEYKNYNELIITANLIRTIPTKLFYEMCKYIHAHIKELRIYNDPEHRAYQEYNVEPTKPVADKAQCPALDSESSSGVNPYSPDDTRPINKKQFISDILPVFVPSNIPNVRRELDRAAN